MALEALTEHLRQHKRRNLNLVRERPEFVSLIGSKSGEAGRRKFWRWVKKCEGVLEIEGGSDGPAHAQAQRVPNQRGAVSPPTGAPRPPGPASQSASRPAQMMDTLNQMQQDIDFMRENALAAGDMRLLDICIRRRDEWLTRMTEFGREFYTIDKLGNYMDEMGRAVRAALVDQPDRIAAIVEKWEEIGDVFAGLKKLGSEGHARTELHPRLDVQG